MVCRNIHSKRKINFPRTKWYTEIGEKKVNLKFFDWFQPKGKQGNINNKKIITQVMLW